MQFMNEYIRSLKFRKRFHLKTNLLLAISICILIWKNRSVEKIYLCIYPGYVTLTWTNSHANTACIGYLTVSLPFVGKPRHRLNNWNLQKMHCFLYSLIDL